jgi:hypothetical protein
MDDETVTATSVVATSTLAERRTALMPAERAVYRAILREFGSGRIPTRTGLAESAGKEVAELEATLARLAEFDLAHADSEGDEVLVAYPFSARPTRHEVELDGRTVHAMCAVDALGIPFMLQRVAEIRSRDPLTGTAISVAVEPSVFARWVPDSAVVIWGAEAGRGASAAICCPVVNFFESNETAAAYVRERPRLRATIASIPEALELGRQIFGDALAMTTQEEMR